MERRKFIGTAGAGMAGILAAGSAPAFAQAQPEIKWRLASSFPKSLDTIYGAAEVMSQARGGERPTASSRSSVFAAGEIVPRLQVLDAVQNGTVRVRPHGAVLLRRQGPGVRVRMRDSVRPERAPAERVAGTTAAAGAVRRVLQGLQHRPLPGGQHRRADGRLVPQGDQDGRRPEGPQDAHRRHRRQGDRQARRGAAADRRAATSIPALEKGTIDAAEWVGPYDDEKLGFNKVAKYYYYPGWWEGGPQLVCYVNIDRVGQAAEGVPEHRRGGLRRSQRLDARQVRRGEPGGAQAPGRGRHAAAPRSRTT